jgi:hypothetical protein
MHVGNESGSYVASPTIAFGLTWRERWVLLKLLHKQLPKTIWTAILFLQPTEKNGGDDGTRTRGLCRDSLDTYVLSATYVNNGGCQSQ